MVSFKRVLTLFALGVGVHSAALQERQLGSCDLTACLATLPLVGPLEVCVLLATITKSPAVFTQCLGTIIPQIGSVSSLNLSPACTACLPVGLL